MAITKPATVPSARKRKAEPASSSEMVKKDVQRKYDLDADTLECPICSEHFAPPVYQVGCGTTQCQNGHTVCSACYVKIHKCHSCSLPVRTFIRCLIAEKIVESLQVSCLYASYGCTKMLRLTNRPELEHTENLCSYRPCQCPVSGCIHEGPKQTLHVHLEKDHQVRTVVALDTSNTNPRSSEVHFRMRASERYVMIKAHVNRKVQLLVHREVIEGLGTLSSALALKTIP